MFLVSGLTRHGSGVISRDFRLGELLIALNDFRAVFFPYCLDKQPDGRYVVLNREYKPIGFKTREHIKYEDYPVCVELKGIGSATAAKLSYKGGLNTDRIYLYNDGCVPTGSAEHMRNYLERLKNWQN